MLFDVFDEFSYTHALSGHRTDSTGGGTAHALFFRARVGEAELQGVDLLDVNDEDRIAAFTVMIRPLSGLNALTESITALVTADPSRLP